MFSYFVLFNLYFVSSSFHFKTFKRINLMDFEKRIYYRRYVTLPIISFKKKKKKNSMLKYFSIQNPRNQLSFE